MKKKRCRSRSLVRAQKRKKELEQERQAQQSSLDDVAAYPPYVDAPRPLSCFEQFVEQQGLLDPSEIPSFLAALRRPLPTNFRIRGEQQEAVEREWQRLVHEFRLDAWPIRGISRAWQVQPTFHDGSLPPPVRSWLARHTKSGTLSRQELVSMLPVALLQVQSHHSVLDLCASPGSKTVQAVDDIYSNNEETQSSRSYSCCVPPLGFVVANELNARRSHILAHRARQSLGQRHASLAIVCHNATKFPNVLAPLRRRQHQHDDDDDDKVTASSAPYDRIICDVPCSGDGTLRKDIKVWKTWHPSYGIALHQLQIRIAKRGIALLKVGGLMTYSTCSFHPVEDEAVVAALLRTGCVEVVPPGQFLPRSIHWRPGRSYWKVLNDECQDVPSKADAPSGWPESLWYCPDEDHVNQQLPNCVRLFPQDNDTGGFFIALLRKIKDFAPRTTRNPLYPPLLTTVSDHHTLHAVHDDDDDDTSPSSQHEVDLLKFRRTTADASGSVFALSRPLANHLVETPGATKLNIVSVGRKL